MKIETSRLQIRELQSSDWRAMKRITTDFRNSQYAAYDHHFPERDEEMQAVTRYFAEEGLWYVVGQYEGE